jgi:flagellar hook-associated protein 1 FlgK
MNLTNRINDLAQKIADANAKIADNDLWGDEANDYRDERNAALDELAKLARVEWQERLDGSVAVFIEGKELVSPGGINKLGFRYASQNYSLVEPVFTRSEEILDYDPTNANAVPLFELSGTVNAYNKNDLGKLKGMMVARGPRPAVYTDSLPSFYVLPTVMRRFDELAHKIVTTINDSLAPNITGPGGFLIADPNAPQGLDGTRSLEVFKRKVDRYNGMYYIEEDPTNYYSLYTLKNLEVNPAILDSTGYSKLAFSKTGDAGNAEVALDMISGWKSSVEPLYSNLIVETATEMSEAKSYAASEADLVIQIDNRRKQISAVSLDEEMTNMMIYQHAFNASARLVNVIDSMIDKIINGTGRAGR